MTAIDKLRSVILPNELLDTSTEEILAPHHDSVGGLSYMIKADRWLKLEVHHDKGTIFHYYIFQKLHMGLHTRIASSYIQFKNLRAEIDDAVKMVRDE